MILLLVLAGSVLVGAYFTNRNLTHTDISVVSDLRVTLVKKVEVAGDIQSISRSNIVATDKKILFFDSSLNLIKETMLPDNSWADFSKDGNLIAQTTAINISEKGSDITFKLMDKSEIVLWKTTNQLTNGPLLSSANGGSGVERICYEGECTDKIFIFNKENLKGKVVNFASELEGARSTDGSISQDGNYFAISFSGRDEGTQLAFFDITGKQLWEYIIPQGWGSVIDVSPRGNFTVATIREIIPYTNNRYLWEIVPHINNVYLFDKQGSMLLKQPVEFVGDFHYGFSDNERFLAVASSSSSGGTLYLFDTGTLKLLWSYNLDQSDRGFTSLDVNDNGIVAAGVSTINREDISDGSLPRYLYVFDSKGVVAFQEKFSNLEFPTWKYGLKILLDQNEDILRVGLKSQLREYRLQDIKENNNEPQESQNVISLGHITSNQVGPFQIGELVPDQNLLLQAKYSIKETTVFPEGMPQKQLIVSREGKNILTLGMPLDQNNIRDIIVTSPEFKTQEGIGIDSTVSDFIKAYPNYKFWYSQEEGEHFVLNTSDIAATPQFILDRSGLVNPDENFDLPIQRQVKISDFKTNAKIVSVRVYFSP